MNIPFFFFLGFIKKIHTHKQKKKKKTDRVIHTHLYKHKGLVSFIDLKRGKYDFIHSLDLFSSFFREILSSKIYACINLFVVIIEVSMRECHLPKCLEIIISINFSGQFLLGESRGG